MRSEEIVASMGSMVTRDGIAIVPNIDALRINPEMPIFAIISLGSDILFSKLMGRPLPLRSRGIFFLVNDTTA